MLPRDPSYERHYETQVLDLNSENKLTLQGKTINVCHYKTISYRKLRGRVTYSLLCLKFFHNNSRVKSLQSF